MKSTIQRAFTKDGKSRASIKDELGFKDNIYYWALLIRILVPVLATLLVLIVTHYLGITIEEFVDAFNQLKEIF